MGRQESFKDWYCPKCDWVYSAALPIAAAEHPCPKTKRVQALKPKS
jgi:rubredoxin